MIDSTSGEGCHLHVQEIGPTGPHTNGNGKLLRFLSLLITRLIGGLRDPVILSMRYFLSRTNSTYSHRQIISDMIVVTRLCRNQKLSKLNLVSLAASNLLAKHISFDRYQRNRLHY